MCTALVKDLRILCPLVAFVNNCSHVQLSPPIKNKINLLKTALGNWVVK